MKRNLCAMMVLGACPAGAWAQADLILYAFDQLDDHLVRMVDNNGDGDFHDPGEATIFIDDDLLDLGIDNAQGLVVLGPDDILITDNFDPDNIVRATDLNGDGDAMDSGERYVWFDGFLPAPLGLRMTNPAELKRGPDGRFYLLDNNTLDTTRPEAIYALEDMNNDGVISGTEVTLLYELSPVGVSATTTFDLEFLPTGEVIVFNITDPNSIESIDVAATNGIDREWITSVQMLQLSGTVFDIYELARNPDTEEILVATDFGGALNVAICALSDINGSGFIDASFEVRRIWSETTNLDGVMGGFPRDLAYVPEDRSILWTDALADQIVRIRDVDNDGFYDAAGESAVVFSDAVGQTNGLPRLSLPLSIAYAIRPEGCAADWDNSGGQPNSSDFLAYLNDWSAQEPRADLVPPGGNGVWDSSDFLAYLNLYSQGC
ncbi:MAG: GC-type dockerin domain-anchored protein [Phycisphaerales bacterium]|jgi:hypothetical protein|nr:GC-type dockerin domain-anchored protein [Phycisphaerales bacterium]